MIRNHSYKKVQQLLFPLEGCFFTEDCCCHLIEGVSLSCECGSKQSSLRDRVVRVRYEQGPRTGEETEGDGRRGKQKQGKSGQSMLVNGCKVTLINVAATNISLSINLPLFCDYFINHLVLNNVRKL